MGKRYSKRELVALIEIEREFGQVTYQNPVMLEAFFEKRTGIHRSSGVLYMCLWRIKKGYYDDILSDRRTKYEWQNDLF